MTTKIPFIVSLAWLPFTMFAQGGAANDQSTRTFEIIVREDSSMSNTRGINWQDNNRRLWGSDMFNLYRTTLASKFSSASGNIVTLGISFLYDKLASHRQDWMQAVQKECSYTKQLSMQTEIVDFYKESSTKGAMDPSNIVFDGFGCRQTLGGSNAGQMQGGQGSAGVGQMPDGQGNTTRGMIQNDADDKGGMHIGNSPQQTADKNVFYVFCSLRTDEVGIERITNHSKFEVVVDSIYFNPYICNLPNDSTAATGDRIAFDFDKRTNLTFSLTATITSSWMNEAIQIYRDVPLGEFHVTAQIDKVDSVFTYSRRLDAGTDKEKRVSVTGDCFIVPRSYVGTLDGTSFTNAWGTGQYKINMQVSETCSINRDYYLEKEEESDNIAQAKQSKKKKKATWNDNWKEEWKIIKKRQKSSSLWSQVKTEINSQFTGKEWITTFIEPAFDSVVQSGTDFIGGETSGGMNGGMSGGSGSTATGDMPMPGGSM